MQKISLLSFVKKPGVWVFVLIAGGGAFLFLRPEPPVSFESEIVTRRTVTEIINVMGTVRAADEIDLTFRTSGTVAAVGVSEGEVVARGQVLARLNSSITQSDIAGARAVLSSREAQLEEMQVGPTELEMRAARSRVETARKLLLTSDIRPHFVGQQREESRFSYAPPAISGTYDGDTEGYYKVTLYSSLAESGWSFVLTGLEEMRGEVSTRKPQPLGSRGLFIQFPENFTRSNTGQTEWLIEIPNSRSVSYVANKRAYDQARAEYELLVSGVRQERVRTQEALVEQARAHYASAQTALENMTLRAPFSGVVRTVSVSPGQTISPAQRAFSLFSNEGDKIVTLYVLESDIANLSVGDRSEVNLNAFPNETYEAHVRYIAPAAHIRDGVTVFKTHLHFTNPDERFRVGMTADVDVFSTESEQVVAVPGRAVVRSEGKTFVRVLEGNRVIEREVTLGLRGYDGRVEIKSGLREGERIITFIRDEDLERLDVEQ